MGAVRAQGIVEGGVAAAAVHETVEGRTAIFVGPNDAAVIVDALSKGALALDMAGQGIVEGGTADADVDEAMHAAAVLVATDEVTCAVDAVCNGAVGGRGPVERDEAIDGHVCSSFRRWPASLMLSASCVLRRRQKRLL